MNTTGKTAPALRVGEWFDSLAAPGPALLCGKPTTFLIGDSAVVIIWALNRAALPI